MIRADIIAAVGRECLVSNIENDEFSYPKAFRTVSLTFVPIQNDAGRTYEKLDIRFVKDNISVLVETKQNFMSNLEEAKRQLSAYVEYEKARSLQSWQTLLTMQSWCGVALCPMEISCPRKRLCALWTSM